MTPYIYLGQGTPFRSGFWEILRDHMGASPANVESVFTGCGSLGLGGQEPGLITWPRHRGFPGPLPEGAGPRSVRIWDSAIPSPAQAPWPPSRPTQPHH